MFICNLYNLSMGIKDMNEYKKEFFKVFIKFLYGSNKS